MSKMKDVKIGKNTKVYEPANLFNCRIGDNCIVGAFAEIGNAEVGNNCKIEANVFIPKGIKIEDNVFIGPHVCFVNDKHPKACDASGKLKSNADWKPEKTIVKKGASIGANSTILCNIIIGENAMIGAGSVVVKDVPPNAVVAGNPARPIEKK